MKFKDIEQLEKALNSIRNQQLDNYALTSSSYVHITSCFICKSTYVKKGWNYRKVCGICWNKWGNK